MHFVLSLNPLTFNVAIERLAKIGRMEIYIYTRSEFGLFQKVVVKYLCYIPPFPTLIGNNERYFSIDPATGKLYVTREIDREALPITSGDIFNMQIEVKQKDNPLKNAIANVSLIAY